MPRADFRSKNDSLDPQALVKLIAVMCYPTDVRGRETMMRHPPASVTIPRHHPGSPVIVDGPAEDFWVEFAEHRKLACLAGALCLGLAQLSALGRRGGAAVVLSLAVELVGRWEQAVSREEAVRLRTALTRRAEAEIIAAYEHYRSVSHLWAAALYGRIQFDEDIVPATSQAVPRFLAYATEIARLSTLLPWAAPTPALELSAKSLWVFVLPTALIRTVEAEVHQAAATVPASADRSYSEEAIDAQT